MTTYQSIDVASYDSTWAINKRIHYSAAILAVECLFGKEEIISQLQTTERQALLDECNKKLKEKSERPKLYDSVLGISPIVKIGGQLIVTDTNKLFIQDLKLTDNIRQFPPVTTPRQSFRNYAHHACQQSGQK